jgi:hypothetical protein
MQVPINTWFVCDIGNNRMALSTHASQQAAEAERDLRNAGLQRWRYGACLLIEPVADRMGCPCR